MKLIARGAGRRPASVRILVASDSGCPMTDGTSTVPGSTGPIAGDGSTALALAALAASWAGSTANAVSLTRIILVTSAATGE